MLRAVQNKTLQPGDSFTYKLPKQLKYENFVSLVPRPSATSWLTPAILQPTDGVINLVNSSPAVVSICQGDHVADLRDTVIVETKSTFVPNSVTHDDKFQFTDFAKVRQVDPDNLKLLQVDPDGVLTESERDIFHTLHKPFESLFTKQPGKYNGCYGFIDNKLQFATPPPPNAKTRVPNYSPSMNNILAEKMDALEQWGVLVEPEKLDISVEYVSPSMIVPKPDSNEYRLVTDFSSLNLYLKKVPNTSATIAQAKSRIARAHYVIHLDLSNYFYQSGLQKEDVKFLGTIHPFKGLRVYTCDPQGLKGASERCYEKLVRIFGDMVQAGRLAQMADGLHILGNSVQELARNYVEVLNRAEKCGLTFKPSKVVVCPKNIRLFGWELKGNMWFPTSHTTSALVNAAKPNTVKQMRSFLGSFKQLSSSLPNYASTIHNLEQIVANRSSAEHLIWTPKLEASFLQAKQLAAHLKGVAEARPEDQLYTYSDYSAEKRAVGGRLVIHRKMPDGTTKELIGGFYSVVLDKHKQAWLPCEGEACGIRLVLEHFSNQIRESNNVTVHYTDSQPCVLAWKRSRRGAFSASSRISAFLTGLSVLPVELRHKPGKEMLTSDFASRNPPQCLSNKCQIFSFVEEWQLIGDNASKVRSLVLKTSNQVPQSCQLHRKKFGKTSNRGIRFNLS